MGKANEKNFNIRNAEVIKSINKLDGFLRAEYNTEKKLFGLLCRSRNIR